MCAETLSEMGEWGLLELLRPMLARHTQGLPLGTGDDVAITRHDHPQRLAWTIDSMVEGTHFRWWKDPLATAQALGHKLVAVNASDLASKGARPLFGLISLGVPAGESTARIRDFYAGVDEAFQVFGGRLIGGDTVRSPQWSITLALVGAVANDAAIAARSNAKPGQHVYVTAPTGDSAAGLAILEGGLTAAEPHRTALVNAHLRPAVSIDRGVELARRFADVAMIDVSDGIANECHQIAKASAVAIELHSVPCSAALMSACAENRPQAEQFALHGGEDYCLLFCTSERIDEPFVFPIGSVREGTGVTLRRADGSCEPLVPRGFSHFKSS